METYQTATLKNGLKVIFEPSATGVVYCGYVVYAGTRDENTGEEGMAHFIEHMTFKGTQRRNSWHINNAIESVGGDLNAYTGKEETVYYTAMPVGELPRAVDVLTDMVFHSLYPQREIDKEVEVISDEIESYNDNPAELIFDEFEELLFDGHSLGRNILGTAQRLRQYTTADARAFTSRLYRPSNCTFYVYGDTRFDKIVKLLEKATAGLDAEPTVKTAQPLPPYKPREVSHDKHTHQAHVIVGARGFSGVDKQRTAFFLLNNILGGSGMNSRLNIILREHSALVYTVESYMASYCDAGVWGVYFGCEPKKVERCRKLILKEFYKFISAPVSPARLAAAKRQLKGQLLVSRNNFASYAVGMGRSFAKYGRRRSIEEQCRAIDALTAESLMQSAQQILNPENLTTLIYK